MVNYKCLGAIKKQSRWICLYAVRCNYKAFKYVRNKTNKLCMLAIKIEEWENNLSIDNIKLAYLPGPGMVRHKFRNHKYIEELIHEVFLSVFQQ